MAERKFAFLASLGFRGWPVEDVVSCLSDLGYHGVEWTMGHFHPERPDHELRALVEIPKRHGLAVSEVVIQRDFVSLDPAKHEEEVNLVADCIRAASRVGIDMLNLFTGPAPWVPEAPKLHKDISEGQAWDLVLDAYERLVPLAEEYRVYLAVETVFGHSVREYYTLAELLSHFDSQFLVVNMDPSHLQLYGNDVPWVIRRLGSKIRHVHLKDAVGRPGMMDEDFTFPLLGSGVVNWQAFVQALDDIGFDGFMSVEFEAFRYYEQVLKNDPAKAAALSMEQITSLFGDRH